MADSYGILAELTIVSSPYGEVQPGAPDSLYRVRFLKRGYTGGVTILPYGTGMPVIQEMPNKADQRFVGLLPQKLQINITANGSFSPRMFYVREEFDIQVRYEEVNSQGAVLGVEFVGWLLSTNAREPIGALPYPFTLTATCGLPLLKTRPLLTVDGTYPEGEITHRDVLMGGLSQIRSGLLLATICNLKEIQDRTTGTITEERDTMTRHRLSAEAFRNETSYQFAADAMQALCVTYRANLTQVKGRWVFYRVNEIRGGWVPANMTGTIPPTASYVRAPEPNVGILIGTLEDYVTPVRLTRNGLSTDLRVELGSTVTLQPTAPVVSIAQTFGQSVSRLINGSFANLGSNGFPAGWEKTSPAFTNIFRIGDGTPGNPFGVRITGSGTNSINLNAPQVIGFRQLIHFRNPPVPAGALTLELKGQPIRITAQWKGEGVRGAKVWVVAQLAPGPAGFPDWAMLSSDGAWLFRPTRADLKGLEFNAFIERGTQATGTSFTKPGTHQIDITAPAMPEPLSITAISVFFCQGNQLLKPDNGAPVTTNPDQTSITYFEPRLTIGDPQKLITGQTVTVTNYRRVDGVASLEQPVQASETLTVGDLPAAIGIATTHAFLASTEANVTVPSYRFDFPRNNAALGKSKPLIAWFALEEAAQQARPAGLFEGVIVGRLPHGPLSVLKLTAQPGADGADSYYQIIQWSWNARLQLHEVQALEILRDNTPISYTATWQTPDGDINQDVDPNTTIDPTGDKIADPVKPKVINKTGKLTQQELLDELRNGGKKTFVPFLLNSNTGDDIIDVTPLTGAEKDETGKIRFYRAGAQVGAFTSSGSEVIKYLALDPPA